MIGAPKSEPPGDLERSGPASGGIAEQLGTLLLAVLVALGIRAFVIEPFRIPSGSMFPTLLVGDHLFVNKFLYGMKIPFSDLRVGELRPPQRGDVVVFTVAKRGGETFPADEKPDLPREEFVKRIVGLPGETVEVRGRYVYIDGERLDMRPTGESFEDELEHRLDVYEVRQGERRYTVLDDPTISFNDYPATEIAPGRYFVLGDNRDHSKDSRIWGTVRAAELKGPAFLLYWSWNFNGSWGELVSPLVLWDLFSDKMRWDRIGDRIH